MPKVQIETIHPWSLVDMGDNPSLEQRFMLHFMGSIPEIMANAMKAAFDEEVAFSSVVPRLVAGDYVREDVTPDIDFTARPSWTLERWAKKEEFRKELKRQIVRILKSLANVDSYKGITLPQVDIDVDFIMGDGCAIGRDLTVMSTWPDRHSPLVGT